MISSWQGSFVTYTRYSEVVIPHQPKRCARTTSCGTTRVLDTKDDAHGIRDAYED